MADLMTLAEQRGPLDKCKIAYIGDGSNVAVSLMEASAIMGTSFAIAAPASRKRNCVGPPTQFLIREWHLPSIRSVSSDFAAARVVIDGEGHTAICVIVHARTEEAGFLRSRHDAEGWDGVRRVA